MEPGGPLTSKLCPPAAVTPHSSLDLFLTINFGQVGGIYVQAQWRENLGIEIVWQTTKWGRLLQRLDQEPPHLFQMGWTADYPDPDNFLRTSLVRRNTRWRNRAYDSLVNEAKRVTDRAERMRLYQQADRILIEQAVILPLLYSRFHFLVKPWLSRYPTSSIKNWFWKDAIIEPH